MPRDWFRNSEWNDSISREFEQKLSRAKRKEQYLRIQASTLAKSRPDVALVLLERYFLLPDDFDHAQAHVDQATAYMALGRRSEAISSLEAALARETAFPKLLTDAYLALPYYVAIQALRDHYPRVLVVLDCYKHRIMFPVDQFRFHTAQALIAADTGDAIQAANNAEQALTAARIRNSGLRYHPSVGLVTNTFDEIIKRLEQLSAA